MFYSPSLTVIGLAIQTCSFPRSTRMPLVHIATLDFFRSLFCFRFPDACVLSVNGCLESWLLFKLRSPMRDEVYVTFVEETIHHANSECVSLQSD